MCELLPCSIPSLALCMKVWTSGGYSPAIYSTVSKALGYTEISLDLIPYPRLILLINTKLICYN